MMAARRLNRRQTDMVLAGAMGFALALAVAFFVIVMPDDVFEELIVATGLPSLLASAEPPLGDTARLITATLGGGFAGLTVYSLFLIVGRQPQRKAEVVRPFSASRDIKFEAAPPKPEIDNEPAFAAEPPLAKPAPVMSSLVPLPVAEEKPLKVEAPVEEPLAAEKVKEAPIFLDFTVLRAVAQPANDPAALDLGEWKVEETARTPEPSKSPRPITAPSQIAEDEPISSLMHRLEAGLERRGTRGETPAQPPVINRSGVGLRSTLDELRKMAVRR